MNEHQSEIHVVPEYIVYNGSKDVVLVKERGKPELIIEADKVGQLRVDSREKGLELSLNFIELEFSSSFVRVDRLGLKVVILHSRAGYPIGSVCIQTVIDTQVRKVNMGWCFSMSLRLGNMYLTLFSLVG